MSRRIREKINKNKHIVTVNINFYSKTKNIYIYLFAIILGKALSGIEHKRIRLVIINKGKDSKSNLEAKNRLSYLLWVQYNRKPVTQKLFPAKDLRDRLLTILRMTYETI